MAIAKKAVRFLLLSTLVTLSVTYVLAQEEELKGEKPCASSATKGWYHIHVVGTGKKCIVKEKEKIKTKTKPNKKTDDNCFAYTNVEFFGIAHCDEGDKGVAKGKVRASVLAEAYNIHPLCAARLIAYVVSEAKPHHKHTDVQVMAGGMAEGMAGVDCSDL